MRRHLLFLLLFCPLSNHVAAAEAQPARRHAVLVGFPPFGQAKQGDINTMRTALERYGYRGVPVDRMAAWTLAATDRDALRKPVNTLKFQPGGELLVVCLGRISLKSDQLFLASDAGQQVELTALLGRLDQLDPETWSVAVVIDARSAEPRDKLLEAIRKWVTRSPANLCVLFGQRRIDAKEAPSPMFAGMCRALTHDRSADGDRDGVVTFAELERYLRDPAKDAVDVVFIPASAKARPVPFVRYGDLTLDELLEDLGGQLAELLNDDPKVAVAIPEFSITASGNRRAEMGILHRYLLEQLRSRLAIRLGEQRIVPHADLVTGLKQAGITAATSDEELGRLAAALRGNPPVDVVRGSAEIDLNNVPPTLTVTARVVNVRAGRMAVTTELAKLTARLVSEELAMSGVWNMSPRRDTFPGLKWEIGELGRPVELAPHPLSNPQFPLRVYLTVNDERVPTEFSADKRQLYATVQPGQDYEIIIENTSGQDLFLRLLVDGRNTLPDRAFGDAGPLQPQQYVSLTRARCWFCVAGQSKYRIGGFYTTIDTVGGQAASAVFQTFRVTDARAVSATARDEGYREQLGVITAAFYQPVEKNASPMAAQPRYATELGEVRQGNVTVYRGERAPGPLLGDAPINIHYGF